MLPLSWVFAKRGALGDGHRMLTSLPVAAGLLYLPSQFLNLDLNDRKDYLTVLSIRFPEDADIARKRLRKILESFQSRF
jgi:hypothetical protein